MSKCRICSKLIAIIINIIITIIVIIVRNFHKSISINEKYLIEKLQEVAI